MSIKLKGATSGSVSLDVPAAVSGGDISLTLPDSVGSANQLLKNGSTAGQLEYGLTLPSGNGSAHQLLKNSATPGTLEYGLTLPSGDGSAHQLLKNSSTAGTLEFGLTLPSGNGSAGQYLRNSSTAGTLEFGDLPASGLFESYAIICDQKSDSSHGGSFSSGAWRRRDLNTEIADPDSIVSVSSNQFTLGAGSYLIEASAQAYDVNVHQARLYNATNSAVVQYGQNAYCNSTYNGATTSLVFARTTITGSTAFEIQHRCETTRTTNGFGIRNLFGGASIFTVVKIFKEA